MKKYLITFLVVCNLSAQSNFTVFAGFNRGDINSGSASVSIANVSIASTIEPLIGMRIGLETQARNWDFGSMFTQRKYREKTTGSIYYYSEIEEIYIIIDTKIDRSIQMDYLSLYATYPLIPGKRARIFGGFELGRYLSGFVHIKEKSGGTISGQVDIPAFSEESTSEITNNMSVDYGLLIGGDFIINKSITVRASYYLGLAALFKGDVDVFTNPDEEKENLYYIKGQHRGIQMGMVFRL